MAWPPPTIEKPPGDTGDDTGASTPSAAPQRNPVQSRPPPPPYAPGGPPPLNGQAVPARVSPQPVSASRPNGSHGADGAPRAPGAEWLRNPQSVVGSVLAGRYRVHTLVGRGSLGLCVEATALATGKPVVLKLLPLPPQQTQEQFVWRVREATALAHFDHQNVEPVFDFGNLPDGGMFLVRNQVPGMPLRLVLRQGRMPLNRVLQIGRQIAHALSSAHTREIVHGRLKPENVLLCQGTEGSDTVKLIDFGLGAFAANLPSSATTSEDQRSMALRTRLYWPATYDGSVPAAPHIDLHALGVVLFEMIAGQPPTLFDATELGLQPPRPAPTFASCTPPVSVPKPVEDVILTLLHPDLARRGPTAEQVFGALDALLSGRIPAATHTQSSSMVAVAAPMPGPSSPPPSNLGAQRPPLPSATVRAPMPPSRRRMNSESQSSVPPQSGPASSPAWAPGSAPGWAPSSASPPAWAPGHVITAPAASVNFDPPPSQFAGGIPPPSGVAWPQPPKPPPEALMAKTWPPPSPSSAPHSGPPLQRPPAPAGAWSAGPSAPSTAGWPPPPPIQAGTWQPAGSRPPGAPFNGPSPAGIWPPPGAEQPPHSGGPPPYRGHSNPNATPTARIPTRPPSNLPRPSLPSGAPLLPDDAGPEFRTGIGGAWSKLKNLVGRRKPEEDDD